MARHYYGIELVPASTQGYDGTRDDKKIEVKTTQGTAVALSSGPEHHLVLKLLPDGDLITPLNMRSPALQRCRLTVGLPMKSEATTSGSLWPD